MLSTLIRLLAIIFISLIPSLGEAQSNTVNSGPTRPLDCTIGSVYISSITGANSICSTGNTWVDIPGSTSIPPGLIVITLTSCPSGWTESTALNGKFLRGTIAANGNVGQTGGIDAATPTGTISFPVSVPSFTGSALAAHAHELPWQIPSTTTIRQIAVATFGTGTSRAATAVSAAGTANTTSAAVALSSAVSGGTPAGTITWPASAPTFSGVAFDNRPAFTNVIFCSKN